MQSHIFLSHIHEERELAIILKNAIEEEFAGFVEVFVSSDGTSIPAGSNFLKRIEDGLVNCIGAIYLISPKSVQRNWINFELGAVWIRSAISVRAGNPEIPTLPICHSGSIPGSLPAPLNNLNAIAGNEASRLEFAFRSIQTAVGGKGRLRVDFDQVASRIRAFEHTYTHTSNLIKVLRIILLEHQIQEILEKAEASTDETLMIDVGILDEQSTDLIFSLAENELRGSIVITRSGWSIGSTFRGTTGSGPKVQVEIKRHALLTSKDEVLRSLQLTPRPVL